MAGSEDEEGRIEQLAKEAERETRSLESDAEKLGERIEETRGNWMRARRDKMETSAPPPEDDDADGSGEADDEAPG
jgi:hypothetical protein